MFLNFFAYIPYKREKFIKNSAQNFKSSLRKRLIKQALREALEEAGCDVELLNKIGELEFVDPDDSSLTHYSVCFLAKKRNDHKTQYFTELEKKNKFKLLWLKPEEAYKLFENSKTTRQFELEMNNRDYKFLKKASVYIN